MFPPGWARLEANPKPTGSPTYSITIGMRGRVLCSARSLSSDGNDEIGFRSHEVGGERRKLVEAIIRVLTRDDEVGALDPAELTKLVQKDVVIAGVARGSAQQSDPRHSRRWLGCGCRREDKQHNKRTGTVAANRLIR